tara:strand:+ start:262 stop:432 length:171 start_codon:yes stop_codon:yes gene_type:complete
MAKFIAAVTFSADSPCDSGETTSQEKVGGGSGGGVELLPPPHENKMENKSNRKNLT